jgi:hypothetical protein
MDNFKELENWILHNSKPLNLKIERLNWINDWFPSYSDFKITTSYKGVVSVGRGIDSNEEIAFLKAFSEVVERITCSSFGINSNGVAAHPDKELAVVHSRKELIERDSLLCHFLTDTPFIHNKLSPHLALLEKKVQRLGIDVTFAEARSPVSNYKVALCNISGRSKFGSFWGYGCEDNLDSAYEHAFFESMINVAAFMDGNLLLEPLSLDDMFQQARVNSHHHQRLHFTKRILEPSLTSRNTDDFPSVKVEDIQVVELKSPDPIINSIPISVIRAKSNKLQDIFYGNVLSENINFERLNSFTNRSLCFDDLVKTPHPIG